MLANKVFIASTLLSGGRLLARFLDLIATLVIASFLSPADFGIVMLAISLQILLRAATQLPVSDALVQMDHLERDDLDTAFTLGVIRGLLVALVMVIAAYPMAAIYDDQRLVLFILVIAVSPILGGLMSPQMVRFTREVNYTPAMIVEVAAKFIAFLCSIAVAVAFQTPWALVIALVGPGVLMTPLTYLFAPYRPRLCLRKFRSLMSFAGWMSLSNLLSNLNNGSDRFIIGAMVSSTATGVFTMGRTVTHSVSWTAAVPLMQAMFPAFAKIKHDSARMRSAYLKALGLTLFAITPLGVGIALIAEPLVDSILSDEWRPAIPVIQVLGPVSAILAAYFMPVQAVMLGVGKPKMLAQREGVTFVIGLPAIVIGTIHFGLMGAVIARSIVGMIGLVLSVALIRKELSIGFLDHFARGARTFASLAVMAAATWMASRVLAGLGYSSVVELALLVATGGLFYLAAHLLAWRLGGKPSGPESEVLKIVASFFPRRAQVPNVLR